MYFASLGAEASVKAVVEAGVGVFGLAVSIICVHALVLTAIGRMFRMDNRTLLLASNAAIGGAGTAAATATGVRGWSGMLPLGVMMASIGYAVGTPAGLAFRALLPN